MEIGLRSSRVARRIVNACHVLVGVAALVFAGVMVVDGLAPNAGLGAVFVGLGLALGLGAALFLYAAILAVRRARETHGGLPLVLSIVELVVGVVLTWGLAVAVQGYGAFEPWRSPLLLPAALLLLVGLAGAALAAAPG